MSDTEELALLLVEVLVDGQRLCVEADSDRLWMVDDEGGRHLSPDPDIGLLRCMRAESVRRYLDVPMDEVDLAHWVARQWRAHCPGREVVPLSMAEPSPSSSAAFAVEAKACPGWCDVESIPARTVDLDCDPSVRLHSDHVRFSVGAYGPRVRPPAENTVVAALWDLTRELPVAQAALRYDADSHTFEGSAPLLESRPHSDLRLDVTSVDQGFRLPRDEDHELAWRRWRVLNQRWARARTLDAILDHVDQEQSTEVSTEVVHPTDCAMSTVIVRRGDHVVAINPAQPRPSDDDALRRLAVVAFHRFAFLDSDSPGYVRRAADVDLTLALGGAGDADAALALAVGCWQWLLDQAGDLADDSDSYFTARVAEACRTIGALLGGMEQQQLDSAAHILESGEGVEIDWALLQSDQQTPIAGRAADNLLRFEMAQWWVDLRARIAAAAWGMAADPVHAPMPPTAGSPALRRDYLESLAYEPQVDGPDAPLLAEVVWARPL